MAIKPAIDIAHFVGDMDTKVNRNEVAKYLGIHPITWDRLVASGKAPERCTPPNTRPLWRVGEIIEWGTANGYTARRKTDVTDEAELFAQELAQVITEIIMKYCSTRRS